MRTSSICGAVAICIAFVVAILMAQPAAAQDQSAAKLCAVSPVSSPSRSLHIPQDGSCDELAKLFHHAVEQFFIAECATLEARRNALNPETYGQADEALKAASQAFARSGAAFLSVAKLMAADIPLPSTDEHLPAEAVLRFYGHEPPKTQSGAFELLGEVLSQAAQEIAQISIGANGDLTELRAETFRFDGALIKPGAVFHAITALFTQSGA